MNRCRGCNAEITWVRTEAGKPMPCDPVAMWLVPDEKYDGTVVTLGGRTVRGYVIARWRRGAVAGHRPHWITCPAADQFRTREVREVKDGGGSTATPSPVPGGTAGDSRRGG